MSLLLPFPRLNPIFYHWNPSSVPMLSCLAFLSPSHVRGQTRVLEKPSFTSLVSPVTACQKTTQSQADGSHLKCMIYPWFLSETLALSSHSTAFPYLMVPPPLFILFSYFRSHHPIHLVWLSAGFSFIKSIAAIREALHFCIMSCVCTPRPCLLSSTVDEHFSCMRPTLPLVPGYLSVFP